MNCADEEDAVMDGYRWVGEGYRDLIAEKDKLIKELDIKVAFLEAENKLLRAKLDKVLKLPARC